jgi:hypothetical protein
MQVVGTFTTAPDAAGKVVGIYVLNGTLAGSVLSGGL